METDDRSDALAYRDKEYAMLRQVRAMLWAVMDNLSCNSEVRTLEQVETLSHATVAYHALMRTIGINRRAK